MVLEAILHRQPREPEPVGKLFTVSAIVVRATNIQDVIHLQHNPDNLESALEHGIKPLTFQEVIDQTDPKWINNLVLFDTSPASYWTPNHFRVVKSENDEPQLQLCGAFGNYDCTGVNPFTPPKVYPMFTGASIQLYKVWGKMATLDETIAAYKRTLDVCPDPRVVRHKADRIYFSDSTGKLIKLEDHPISQKKAQS